MTRSHSSRVLSIFVFPVAVLVGCNRGEEMKIGAVLPLTGVSAVYGEAIQRGIDLAVEQLQAPDAPETLDFTVALLTEDSASDPQQAAAKLRDVYAAGATAAIGGVTSEEALAMVPVAEQAGSILLSPTASSPKLSGISQYFFRIFPSARDEATNIARHMLDAQQVTTVAIVYQDDAFGQGTGRSLRRRDPGRGARGGSGGRRGRGLRHLRRGDRPGPGSRDQDAAPGGHQGTDLHHLGDRQPRGARSPR
jgi:ABC-type branched-subunit amino acid transport system substrate-binding protein